ncbi:MAG: PaaI family thioesterase [Candidatus Dormibacteria bacterium]
MSDEVDVAAALTEMNRSSDFLRLLDYTVEEADGSHVDGWFDASAAHHQPFGIVHGGVYAALVETFASIGGWLAVREQGLRPVGIANSTDFLRPESAGRMRVRARALHQGRTQQLWEVVITREDNGKKVALGRLRLQNVPGSAAPPA